MYHAVTPVTRSGSDPHDICISPELFETQMLFLKRHNLRGVSLRELLSAARAGETRGLIGLTFDDGYEHFSQTVLPVLERLGFACTIFVPTSLLEQDNSWISEPRMKLLAFDAVRELSKCGVEIASHGAKHIRLPGLSPQRLDREVNSSRQVLSELLDEEVEGFCYPYGSFDSRVIQAVKRAGYTYACTALEGVWQDSAYAIPRIFVGKKDTLLKFRAKLWIYPKYVYVARIRRMQALYALLRRTPLWKPFVRRLWYS
jgi:peptidoglycan/xylan/chitin deacetylase (PgdA/CDA1 family)